MVGNVLWQNLKVLAELDEALLKLQQQVDVLKEEQTVQDYSLEDAQEELYELEQALVQEKKNVALQELYAKELDGKQQQLRAKMTTITSKKELEALEKETNDLVRRQEQHDQVVVKVWHQRELITKKIDLQKKVIEQKESEVKLARHAHQERIDALHNDIQSYEQKRQKVLKLLPEDWIKRYDRVKGLVKDPIVQLVQQSCGACFYLLASKDFVMLKQHHIISCRNCYRFIYYDTDLKDPVS